MTNAVAIDIPGFVRWLHVDVQYDVVVAWVEVDPAASIEPRRLHVRGTGHPMTGEEGDHIGSVQLQGGALVFHIFDEVNK